MCENGVTNPLITIHEVAEKILNHLPLTELLRKRCVCKFWRDCVDRIVRCRPKNVAIKSNFFKGLHDSYYVDCTLRLESIPSEDSNDSDAYRSPSTRRSKRSRIAAVARNFSSIHLLQSFLKWRESWTSYPQFILMIHKLNVNWVDEDVEASYRKFHDTLVKHIPPATELIIVRASSDEVIAHCKFNCSNGFHQWYHSNLSALTHLPTSSLWLSQSLGVNKDYPSLHS